MTPVWPLPNNIGMPFVEENAPDVLVSTFGDGFEQRSDDGINTLRETYTVTLPGLTTAERDTARTFLRARKGREGFLFTPPNSPQKKYYCPDWQFTLTDVNNYDLIMMLREDFNP
jgi:phage-related protein